jgi:protein gp37
MAQMSSIEWTDATWNPVSGCSKLSLGCEHCYAQRMAHRLQAMGLPAYANGFAVTLHPEALAAPLCWKKPRMVFVNSMGDLFHEEIPLAFIKKVFAVIAQTPHHTYQVLTKRAERLSALSEKLQWPGNLWMGVTVESSSYVPRIQQLLTTPASVKFLSLEPLLGPLPKLPLKGIDWVIVGGESGPGARPMERAWATQVRDQCVRSSVPFFFKQWGGVRKKAAGRSLEGRTWDELPLSVRSIA